MHQSKGSSANCQGAFLHICAALADRTIVHRRMKTFRKHPGKQVAKLMLRRNDRWLSLLWLTAGLALADSPDENFQAVLDGAVRLGIPAVSASVVWDDHTWAGAAGVVSAAAGGSLNANSRYRLASITKLFTATVILQLVDERQLSLDDTLAKKLPNPPPGELAYADTITISMLLDHTSGVRSFTDISGFWREAYGNRGLDRIWRPAELIDFALLEKPYFEPRDPGQRHYSNSNYVLLGMIIERTTGQTLAENYRSRIFRPLGLTHTILEGFEPGMHLVQHSFHKAGFAERLVAKRRGWVKAPQKGVYDLGASYQQYNSWGWAAGGLSSNTADLNLFLDALRGEKLLSRSSREVLLRNNSATVDAGVVFGGSGGWDGISTSAYDLNGEAKFIVLLNGTGFGVSADDLLGQLFQVFINKK